MLTPTTAYITLMSWLAGLLTLCFVPGALAVISAPAAAATITVILARALQLDRDTVLRAVALLTVRVLTTAVVGLASLALRALAAADTRLNQQTTQPTYIRAA